ncbi:MAG TPA: electron transfer flavoprotein-ubiquinone oxidoreductase [Alphaproteobacteria bacterium]|nr:electron transfer flavoprotein-ubiquinone oxidoreductase [Alphaproteobacteria bacterium]
MTVSEAVRPDREAMMYDVVIVGAGPAGLSCAIKLKQLANETGKELAVCILEKGSEVGAHLLSGAVFETRSLDELIPDWKEKGAPLRCQAKKDKFLFLTKTGAIPLPTPPQMHNKGNYIISLGELGRWLAQQAEALGVEIFPGFAAAELLFDEKDCVIGVATGDMGIDKNGEKTPMFEPGVEIHARQTILAEGCHGSLTKQVIQKYDLRKNSDPQTYGLGIKEIWEIDPAHHDEGSVIHTVGWPMDNNTYGGSWLYHMENNMISIGFVVGLDYQNPYLSPFEEMQRFKTHPSVSKILAGGRRVSYGARALVEGGFQSIPKLTFPGGCLTGDSAGFLNVPKIKGNHTAIKSGMITAKSIFSCLHLEETPAYGWECASYARNFENSWLRKELYKVRNIRPGFRWGLWAGMAHAAFQTIGGWILPYTLKNHSDYDQLKKAAKAKQIDYPKPDGVLTFDRLTSVQLSNTNHEENQPCHLKLKDPSIPLSVNLPEYAEPAQRYCPAAVYEIIEEKGEKKFQINAQNCVHCKTCDIKDPSQNINWTVPQGGGGPNYGNM